MLDSLNELTFKMKVDICKCYLLLLTLASHSRLKSAMIANLNQ